MQKVAIWRDIYQNVKNARFVIIKIMNSTFERILLFHFQHYKCVFYHPHIWCSTYCRVMVYPRVSWKVLNFFHKFYFVGVSHLATYIFLNFQIEPELSSGINPGMAFTPFPFTILDETRFKPTTIRLWVEYANHLTRLTPLMNSILDAINYWKSHFRISIMLIRVPSNSVTQCPANFVYSLKHCF